MRDQRRHIRPVEQSSGDSGEIRLTKSWWERPLSRKVKALGTLAGALTAIGSFSAGAGRFVSHKADEALVRIIKRELAPVVAAQQLSDRLSSEREGAIKASVDTLTLEVRAMRAAIEKPKKRKGAREQP